MSRASGLCGMALGVLLSGVAGPVAADIALAGFLQQNTAFNTAGANPDGRNYKWLEERAQVKLDGSAGAWRLMAKGDFAHDHLGRGDRSELREAYVDYTASSWDVRAGRQVLTWGLGDLVFVNDVWPKDYEALFAGRPLEYLKRGIDAVKLGAYPAFASFELVLAPAYRASRVPDAGRFHLFDPMPGPATRRTAEPDQGEAGLRIYRELAGYDVALYLYRGFQRTPSMRPDGMSAPARITLFYPKLAVYGASASGRAGEGVVSLEAAYYDARQDRSGSDFTVPNAQTRLLAGYQWQPWEDGSLGLQYYAEYMHDYRAYRASLPAGLPADKRRTDTFTARLTQFFLHQTLRLSFYAAYNHGNGDRYLNPELRYAVSDRVWVAVGANVFGGRRTGQFGQLARDDNLYWQTRYEF